MNSSDLAAHNNARSSEFIWTIVDDSVLSTVPNKVLALSDDLSATSVLLDNQATRGIFGNPNLLDGIHRVQHPTSFTGVGGSIVSIHVGLFKPLGIWVHYAPRFGFNVLSFAEVENLHKISYQPKESFTVTTKRHNTYAFMRSPSGLWVCDFRDMLALKRVSPPETVVVQTVSGNESMYPKREVAAAKQARELSKLLGYPSPSDLQSMLHKGGLNNSPVTAVDVQRAQKIYGPEVAALKGKTRLSSPTRVTPVPLPRYVTTEITLLSDLMFVEGDCSLVSVASPLGLLMATHVADKNLPTLRAALDQQIRECRAREFIVTTIWSDPEGAIIKLKSELQDANIKLEIASTKKHVPGIEVRIRVIKERCRAILNTLPYLLPRSLLKHLISYVVSRINMVPTTTTRLDGVSPREAFIGRKADYKLDCRIAFGTCVQINTFSEPSNSMAPRTELAIALEPTGHINGSVKFWVWRTKRIVTRESWPGGELPFSESMIQAINDIAKAEGNAVGRNPRFMVGNHEVVDIPSKVIKDSSSDVRLPLQRKIEDLTHVDAGDLPVVLLPPASAYTKMDLHPAQDLPEEPDDSAEGDHGVSPLEDEAGIRPSSTSSRDDHHIDDDNEGDEDEKIPTTTNVRFDGDEVLTPLEKAALDSRRVHRSERAFMMVDQSEEEENRWRKLEHCFQISVKKAIEKWGDHAMSSIMAELEQMNSMKVFHPVLKGDLSPKEWSKIIRCHMFLKEKFDAEGIFEKIKARLVAGGDQQDRTIYDSISSPTASLTAVLMVVTIAAREGRVCKVADVTGAYLNALMGDIVVHMRIDGQLADLLVKIRPDYARYRNGDGSIIVRLDKALYGCIEAAKLWYILLSSTLVNEYHMTANPYDKCVFNRQTASGHQLTVVVYVDDLFITCSDPKAVDDFVRFIQHKFKTITVHDGPILSYLGMRMNFEVPGKVSVTMPGYVNDLLDNLGVQGSVTTPATAQLLDINQDEKAAPVLSVKDAKIFHTIVAKLLYLAKRSRPDILVAVTFLTSRVQRPTSEDQAKLDRILKYLNGTRQLGITLEQHHNFPVAYCDASYGVHHDSKSHTGLFITLGAGPIFVGSTKQKIVVKSSTEAELVALSDSASQIIWTREFMCAQLGENPASFPSAIVMEDNKSTIALLKVDHVQSQRTKHINIRYFFLKDRMAKGEVFIRYMDTENMIADILTKPLQGTLFSYLRAKLLNS
jgi:hypothetical protein